MDILRFGFVLGRLRGYDVTMAAMEPRSTVGEVSLSGADHATSHRSITAVDSEPFDPDTESRRSQEPYTTDRGIAHTREGDQVSLAEYEPPCVVDIGHVRELTGGSSGSGRSDANSQYYW
jgi:hypothetical protein